MRTALGVVMLVAACGALATPSPLHRYWPRYPRPAAVATVADIPDRATGTVVQTLAGLVARAELAGKCRELVWYPVEHPAYRQWLGEMVASTHARLKAPEPTWKLVARYRKLGIVKGYILYHYDDSSRGFHEEGQVDASANVATSLCASTGAIAVADTLEPQARAAGLKRLMDARGMTEEECFDRYSPRFSRKVLARIEPKCQECRAEAVAMGAFVMSSRGELYEKALARLDPDTPILGWGLGDEYRQTEPSTRWGSFQTATNWCADLPPLSTEDPAAMIKPGRATGLWDLKWEDGVHYASFVMSDGDNVQWLMGNFLDGERSWWGSSDRGSVPIGWTACTTDLAQVSPYTLRFLHRSATPNDDLVLMSGGYFYPDLYGASRKGVDVMKVHMARMAPYMKLAGVRAISANFTTWDSPKARVAAATMAAQVPDLQGVLAFQYSPYAAGGGKTYWVDGPRGRRVPVVSPRFGLWSQSPFPCDGGPTAIAERLNALPVLNGAATTDNFSWVIVHAWSYWRRSGQGRQATIEDVDGTHASEANVARGMAPVRWCAEKLDPTVRLVKPTDLLMLMQLRLQPAATLNAGLATLAGEAQAARRPAVLGLVKSARAMVAAGRYHEAFTLGKRARGMMR